MYPEDQVSEENGVRGVSKLAKEPGSGGGVDMKSAGGGGGVDTKALESNVEITEPEFGLSSGPGTDGGVDT